MDADYQLCGRSNHGVIIFGISPTVLSLFLLLPLMAVIGGSWATDKTKGGIETARSLNAKCRDLFSCAIRKDCVQVIITPQHPVKVGTGIVVKLDLVEKAFDNSTITNQLYNDLDKGIDYGCIFTSGCMDECMRCPLCQSSKKQLVDVLSGNRRNPSEECSVLVQCSVDCVEKAKSDFAKINYCLRHQCAFHCFDGSCPKCSAFTTRIFNQICVNGGLRRRVRDWNGHCYEMFRFTSYVCMSPLLNILSPFRGIVFAKFKDEFNQVGRSPSIGQKKHPPPQLEPLRVVVHSGNVGK